MLDHRAWCFVSSNARLAALIIFFLCAATADYYYPQRSDYDRPWPSYSKPAKTCPACPTCAPPCAVTPPSVSPTPACPTAPSSNCTDNPCYFQSLPYTCTAEQCATLPDNALGTKAIIFGVPDRVCITSCQLQTSGDAGFILFQFGACTLTDDLSTQNLAGTGPNVASSLSCTSPTSGTGCFKADIDRIVTRSDTNCNTATFSQDTTLSCKLSLGRPSQPEIAEATFDIFIKYTTACTDPTP